MTSFAPDRTYDFTQRWSNWDGRDDHEPEPDEDYLDRVEDNRNESRIP